MIWMLLKLEKDIMVLTILSKLSKVPYEVTCARDPIS